MDDKNFFLKRSTGYSNCFPPPCVARQIIHISLCTYRQTAFSGPANAVCHLTTGGFFFILKMSIGPHGSLILSFIMIHQIFLLAREWSKRSTWPNSPQLKLGDIREHHLCDIPQFLNLMSSAISLKFNLRWEKVLWLLHKKKNLFWFFKSYQRTLKRKHSTLHTISCS